MDFLQRTITKIFNVRKQTYVMYFRFCNFDLNHFFMKPDINRTFFCGNLKNFRNISVKGKSTSFMSGIRKPSGSKFTKLLRQICKIFLITLRCFYGVIIH